MLVGFLDEANRWEDHIRRYTNALTAQMVFGFRTTSIDDPKMHRLFDVGDHPKLQIFLLNISSVSRACLNFLVPLQHSLSTSSHG